MSTPMKSLILLILLFRLSDISLGSPVCLQNNVINVPRIQEQSRDGELSVTASFSEKRLLQPSEPIELLLGRPLKESDGRLGVLIGDTDVSSLFSQVDRRLRYDPKLWPLPLGEATVTVYLVSNTDEWKELERFTLVVENESASREGSNVSGPHNFEAAFIKTSYFDQFASLLGPRLSLSDESTNARNRQCRLPSPRRRKEKSSSILR